MTSNYRSPYTLKIPGITGKSQLLVAVGEIDVDELHIIENQPVLFDVNANTSSSAGLPNATIAQLILPKVAASSLIPTLKQFKIFNKVLDPIVITEWIQIGDATKQRAIYTFKEASRIVDFDVSRDHLTMVISGKEYHEQAYTYGDDGAKIDSLTSVYNAATGKYTVS